MSFPRAVSVFALTALASCAAFAEPPAPDIAPDIAPEIAFEPYVFEATDGAQVDAERGVFSVPENREDPDSRSIDIHFVRFASTSEDPGPPIVYLAGGPGGSGVGTARGRRFPLFMAMREFGDVIALDQRGTGWSNDVPPCRSGQTYPRDRVVSDEDGAAIIAAAVDECAAFWRDAGVDLAGYNTLESARDIDALRRGLGADTVTLWGISYGSHLAFAALKEMPGHVDRVVLAAVEGLDATVKLPARTDAYFARLQAVIDADPAAKAAYPDVAGLMRRVHDRLAVAPERATFTTEEGEEVSVVITDTEMRLLMSGSIADPVYVPRMLAAYVRADAGGAGVPADVFYNLLRMGEPMTFAGMPEAMDIMSGVSEARLALVEEQARTALLGDLLNFPMPHLRGAFGLPDLGEDFRAPVETDVATLAFTGTLDGRTYPEGAADALAGFSNLSHVIVENGGHNVFMQDPAIAEIILAFMRGDEVPDRVTLAPPAFVD